MPLRSPPIPRRERFDAPAPRMTVSALGRSLRAVVYHDIAAPQRRDEVGIPGPVAAPYKLDPLAFAAHLGAIARAGVVPGLPSGRPDAMLTFDDGGASAVDIADALESHGWRGAFFVVTDRIGSRGFLDPVAIVELAARGHAIGSHSASHPGYMARLPAAALAYEWRKSHEALAELLGTAPELAAVPGGSVSRSVIAHAAAAGYGLLFTSTPTVRVRRVGEMQIAGRCTIWASDGPDVAARYLSGERAVRVRRRLGWELKSTAKRLGPRLYESLRRARAARR